MSQGYGYGWGTRPTKSDREVERAAKKAREEQEARDREEAQRWSDAGYVSYPPVVAPKTTRAFFDTKELLATDFIRVRTVVEDIEDIIGSLDTKWSEKDKKRLDKAIVLIKIGAKFLEKVLKRHGFKKVKYGIDNPSRADQPYLEANPLCHATSRSLADIPASG